MATGEILKLGNLDLNTTESGRLDTAEVSAKEDILSS
jgi:hypothetical protein